MHWALVPAYNEEKNIEEVIRRLKKQNVNVLVVDDGSKDKTYIIAEKKGAIVLRHKKNKGKGEALKTGINYLKKRKDVKYVAIVDADMQFLPEEIEKIFEPLKKNKADMVMGKRNFKKVPFRHKLGNIIWRTTFNFLFGTKFEDTNCGYIGLSRKALEKIKRIQGGYIIENCLLIEALKNKLRVEHVPVTVMYKKISGIKRGIRIVLGVLVFIIVEGLKYRLHLS